MTKLKYPYSRPSVEKKDIDSVVKALKSQFLTQGKVINDFENKLAIELFFSSQIAFNKWKKVKC